MITAGCILLIAVLFAISVKLQKRFYREANIYRCPRCNGTGMVHIEPDPGTGE